MMEEKIICYMKRNIDKKHSYNELNDEKNIKKTVENYKNVFYNTMKKCSDKFLNALENKDGDRFYWFSENEIFKTILKNNFLQEFKNEKNKKLNKDLNDFIGENND